LLIVATFVNIGMWWERFVIIVQSLHRDFLPGAWGNFTPSWVDWLQMAGDFGLFFTLTLLFMRYLPMISMAEIKGVLPHGFDATKRQGDEETRRQGDKETRRQGDDDAVLVSKTEGGSGETWGIVAEFAGPEQLMEAAKKLRDVGYTTLDAYTPYPVHGMVKAIGMKRSRLPWITLCGSITGLATAAFMQFYLMGWYYPTIVQDKQIKSWEAFVPIMFELMVLFSAIFTVFGMLGLCGLPKFFHPLDQYNRLGRATDDAFFLSVEASDLMFDAVQLRNRLAELGGYNIASVEN
jgi:hypothetical protein